MPLIKPYLALTFDLLQITAAFAAFLYFPKFLWPLLSVWLGFCYFAMFGLGHDGGHRLLARNPLLNDILGQLAMVPVLWSLEIWRQDHQIHHRYTNLYPEDKAFRPLTLEQYEDLPRFSKLLYRLSRSYLIFISTMILQVHLHSLIFTRRNLKHRRTIFFQIALIIAYLAGIWYIFGVSGLLILVCLPQLVFNLLFAMIAFLQHTNPAISLKSRNTWDSRAENLYGTVHIQLHPVLDWYTHYTNHHLAHHNFVTMPASQLPKITSEILDLHGEKIVRVPYSWAALIRISKVCFIVEKTPEGHAWLGAK